MNDYNGYTGSERMIVHNIMKELQKKGIINWKDQPCSVCGQKEGTMQPHLEDYSKIFDFHPICIECHMKLHWRFRYPGLWIKHLVEISMGYVSKPYKNIFEYTGSKRGTMKFPEFEKTDPVKLGNEWYHKIAMTQIDKNKFKQYNKDYEKPDKQPAN